LCYRTKELKDQLEMVNGEFTKLKDARLRQTEMVNKYSYKYIFRKQHL